MQLHVGYCEKFEDQNIISFEDNVKFMGDVHFVIYFDFETKNHVINKPMIFSGTLHCIQSPMPLS